MKVRDPMKKRLLSLLLAAAMLLAVVPVSVFAEGEPNVPLHINSAGKPDVTGIVPTKDSSNHDIYVGDGWRYVYTSETYSSLYLGVDSEGNALSGEPIAFKFNNPTDSSCSVNIYNASLSDSTVNAGVWVESSNVSVTNCVLDYLSITTSNGASATVKNCIFPNSSHAVSGSGSCTLAGWNIFAKDPGASDQRIISVTNDGKITKLKVGSMDTAMDTADLYVVGSLDHNLKLTLDDGTVHTISKTEIADGSRDLAKHVPLTIKEDGTPNVDGMTFIGRDYYNSDDWSFYPANPQEAKPARLVLGSSFSGAVGPNPVKCKVENGGTITGGVFYGPVSSASYAKGTIQGGIFLGNVATDQKIEGGVFVGAQVNDVKEVSCPAELGKIQTITLGNDTVTLDVAVDSFYFGGTPTNLSVTLEDGTVYKNIDTSAGSVKLAPKPEEPDYYSVTVEGGIAYAHDETNTILDSETPITAGTTVTLKLLDETQGEMVFSYWDVNDNDTALADELAKTGFDKTAHETSFTMPAHDLRLVAKYRMPDEDAPQDDSFLMTAAAVTGGAVLTGLVVWQGYNIFSQVYLNAHLPEGTAIPANRQQLALLLWNTADRPEASAASYVFPDVADPDVQSAARWATEQGLLKARKDGTFAPMDSVSTGQVYRAWQKVKAAG